MFDSAKLYSSVINCCRVKRYRSAIVAKCLYCPVKNNPECTQEEEINEAPRIADKEITFYLNSRSVPCG